MKRGVDRPWLAAISSRIVQNSDSSRMLVKNYGVYSERTASKVRGYEAKSFDRAFRSVRMTPISEPAEPVHPAVRVVGGRNAELRLGEYSFDLGPTFLMMKFLLDELFVEGGRRSSDYLQFQRLDPMYSLNFPDKTMFVRSDPEAMKAETGSTNLEGAFIQTIHSVEGVTRT